MTVAANTLRASAGASTFDPVTSITWHSAFWASDPNWSNPGNGNAVSSWRNAGTSGVGDASQGTGTRQPIFRSSTSTLNNQATVEFDASNDDLSTATFTSVAQPFSVVVVGNLSSISGFNNLWYGYSANGSPFTSVGRRGDVNGKFFGFNGAGDGVQSSVAADTNTHFLTVVFASSPQIIVDATTSTFATPNAGTAGAVQFWFNSNALGGNWGGGHRAFVGLYSGTITSDANWSAFKSWASSFYGVTT